MPQPYSAINDFPVVRHKLENGEIYSNRDFIVTMFSVCVNAPNGIGRK